MPNSPHQKGIELAISRAIEGGYDTQIRLDGDKYVGKYYADMFLDPLFWQALGKVEGWDKSYEDKHWGELLTGRKPGQRERGPTAVYKPDTTYSPQPHEEVWKYVWHRFIDHIAEGKSADDFFDQSLTKE